MKKKKTYWKNIEQIDKKSPLKNDIENKEFANQLPVDKKVENEALAALYNKKGYFPWVIVFSANGKTIGAFAYEDKAVSEYLKAIESFE